MVEMDDGRNLIIDAHEVEEEQGFLNFYVYTDEDGLSPERKLAASISGGKILYYEAKN